MAVLPESMNKLDLQDGPGSLSRIENYIRYMVERIEFAMSNMGRNVGEAGTSSVEVLLMVKAMANDLAKLTSAVGSLTGEVTSANTRITEMQESIESIQGDMTALGERVTALEGNGG